MFNVLASNNTNVSTEEIVNKYFPEESSFWMYAMITLGSSFIVFVAITIYMMCSPERH